MSASGVPEVSVVMGGRAGAAELPGTSASVLAQKGVELELVVVDDGSTDATPALLAELAAGDPRLRILRQDPQGLTAALIYGCAAARAPLIARQDAGDWSHQERLRRLRDVLQANPGVVLVSSWAACLGPSGEPLFVELGREACDLPVAMLRGDPPSVVAGPTSHGSAMFRAEAYRVVGGYRREVALGQDWDLWQRLSLVGEYFQIGLTLYAQTLGERSLSFAFRDLQMEFGRLSLAALRARVRGESEASFLGDAVQLSHRVERERAQRARHGPALGAYHVGELLRRAGDSRCRRYFLRALGSRSTAARAAVRLAQSLRLAPRPPTLEQDHFAWVPSEDRRGPASPAHR
ncbi:MAG TPA: glycosyltransferase family 2 protein [Planctomycetota bacterium]|nr:glycosyltransferase family 2 protein [Planctomycetota bacterium]